MAEEALREPITSPRTGLPALWRRAASRLSDRRGQAALVLGSLALMYLAVNLRWLQAALGSGVASTYVAQPVLWTAISAGILYLSWKHGLSLRYRAGYAALAVLVGLFHLSALVMTGLGLAFGASPYTRGFPAVLANVAFFVTALMGVELARAALLSIWRPRNRGVAVALFGIVFAFMSVPLSQVTGFQSGEAAVRFLGLRGLPALGEHALATYMALLGGPLAAIAYRGVLEAFEWLSPVLPNLPWALSGLLGMVVPYIGYLAFRSVAEPQPVVSASRVETKKKDGAAGWLALSFLSVGILWFSFGLFPYHPLPVAGQSMYPELERGDLAILRTVEPSKITVGSVIQYRTAQASILHRVIEVREGPGGARLFVTKGDANSVADPAPVSPAQVTGELAFSIPKVGWLGILAIKGFSWVVGLF